MTSVLNVGSFWGWVFLISGFHCMSHLLAYIFIRESPEATIWRSLRATQSIERRILSSPEGLGGKWVKEKEEKLSTATDVLKTGKGKEGV